MCFQMMFTVNTPLFLIWHCQGFLSWFAIGRGLRKPGSVANTVEFRNRSPGTEDVFEQGVSQIMINDIWWLYSRIMMNYVRWLPGVSWSFRVAKSTQRYFEYSVHILLMFLCQSEDSNIYATKPPGFACFSWACCPASTALFCIRTTNWKGGIVSNWKVGKLVLAQSWLTSSHWVWLGHGSWSEAEVSVLHGPSCLFATHQITKAAS